ncbi:histidine kinase [Clostridia bacterium]|nr:histidine kinase [Clostridia bacterium]
MTADTTGYSREELEKALKKANREVARLKAELAFERVNLVAKANQYTVHTFEQRQHEKYMKLLLGNAPNPIAMLDKSGRLAYCTDTFLRDVLIDNVDKIRGRTLRDIFQGITEHRWRDEIFEIIDEAERANRHVSFDDPDVITADGELHKFEIHYVPMTCEDGHREGSILIGHDVTEIELMRSKAEQASVAKSDFLSNMSHEMRTPLNAVIGMTNIAQSSSDMEKKDYCLSKINEASVHLLGVINDILDMSKIEANKLELSYTEFNFERMVAKIAGMNNFRVEEKHQRLTIKIARNIPDRIVSDEQRLGQVITNLLSNAVKFTPDGGQILLNADMIKDGSDACMLRVEIIDDGIGISEEQQSRLFQSFQQADSSTSRQFGGTGLGLVICKSIVGMMGGAIWVESRSGEGSTFAFTFRAGKGTESGNPLSSDSDAGGFGDIENCFLGRRILLAEDIDINREIVIDLMEPTRIEIDCAENGIAAVEMFAENPGRYDAVLMDVQMPEMDGYEATRRIRAMKNIPNAASIPIIAMTANVFREDIEKCLASGMNEHLGKPIDVETVIQKLKLCLGVEYV